MGQVIEHQFDSSDTQLTQPRQKESFQQDLNWVITVRKLDSNVPNWWTYGFYGHLTMHPCYFLVYLKDPLPPPPKHRTLSPGFTREISGDRTNVRKLRRDKECLPDSSRCIPERQGSGTRCDWYSQNLRKWWSGFRKLVGKVVLVTTCIHGRSLMTHW